MESPSVLVALRILVLASILVAVGTVQGGCGADHVGQIIGIDPVPDSEGGSAPATPTTT